MMNQEKIIHEVVASLGAPIPDDAEHLDAESLESYFRGDLEPLEDARLQEHMARCVACAEKALDLAHFLGCSPPQSPRPESLPSRLGRRWRSGLERLRSAAEPRRPIPLWAAVASLFLALGLAVAWLVSTRAPLLNVPVATLESASFSRGARADELTTVAPGAVLMLLPAREAEESVYGIEILHQSGKTIWKGSGLRPNSNGSFHLQLPRRLAAPQEIRIRLRTAEGRVFEEFSTRIADDTASPVSFRLEAEDSPERRLTAGAVHSYNVEIEIDEFIHVVIEQKGVDVIARVFDPRGRRLFEVDSPTGNHGEEEIYLVAEASGVHRIELRPLDERRPEGLYRLGVRARRPASDDDRLEAGAFRAFVEARQIEQENRGALPPPAVEKYLRAAQLWRRLGRATRQGEAYYRLARMYREADRPHQAIAFYEQALELQIQAGPRALTLNDLAAACLDVGERRRARGFFEAALELHRATGFRRGEATTLVNLGKLHQQEGRMLEALEHFEQALPLAEEIDHLRGWASVKNALGSVYAAMGESRLALEQHAAVQARLDPRRDRELLAQTLSLEGNARHAAGDLIAARAAYERSLALFPEGSTARARAVAWTGIGLAHSRGAEPDLALAAYREALDLFERRHERRESGIVLNNLGWLYHRIGRPDEAREHHRRALELAREATDQSAEAAALFGLARVEQSRDLDAAIALMSSAVELIEDLRHQTVRSDLRISHLASHQGYYDALIELLMRKHDLHPPAGWNALAFGVSEKSRARQMLESLGEKRSRLLEDVGPELLARFEMAREAIRASEDERLRLLSLGGSAAEIAAVKERQHQEIMDYRAVEGQIRRASPWYAGLAQPAPLTWSEIQAALDEETSLFEIHLGEARSHLWALTRNRLRSFELPRRSIVEAAARRAYELLIKSHHAGQSAAAERAAESLSRMILGPAAAELENRHLLFVVTGALQYIPFAALPKPSVEGTASGPLLGLEHEITSLPSASIYALLRERSAGRDRQKGLLAVVADPVLDPEDERLKGLVEGAAPVADLSAAERAGLPDLERLPYSRREAEAILRLAAGGESYRALGFDAHRDLVLNGRLADYRLVHFSTHGVLDTEHPELSALLLSRFDARGRPRRGRLQAHEIQELELPVELVVLGACETALGREMRGEGLLSLTRSFLYAGSAAVLVSLWKINDHSTAVFMEHFYRGLLRDGLSPAAALRLAQREVRADPRWRAPYYWAGFTLQGIETHPFG